MASIPIPQGESLCDAPQADAPTQSSPVVHAAATRAARLRRWLIVALSSIVVPVLIGEIFVRVALPAFARDSEYYPRLDRRCRITSVRGEVYDKKFGWTYPANAQKLVETPEFRYVDKTNSLGFRGRELEPRRKDEYHVMFIGDSVTYGVGVEFPYAYPQVVEELAAQSSGHTKKLISYNFAIPGYDTVQDLVVLRTYFDQVQPDHVVLTFATCDDFLSNYTAKIDTNGNRVHRLEERNEIQDKIRKRYPALDKSMLFRLFAFRFLSSSLYYELARAQPVMTRSCQLLDEFVEFCRARRANATVVIDYAQDVMCDKWYCHWTGGAECGKPLAAYCRAHDIEVVDLLDNTIDKQDMRKQYFPIDGHPNRLGYRRMADAVYSSALERRLKSTHSDAEHEARGRSRPAPLQQ
jgi:GDSL-like Lipase/Acylhydrolase family